MTRREFATSVRAWQRAFAEFPELLDRYPHRYNAACAAALTASGEGDDGAATPIADRDAARHLAHAWLTAEIDRWREQQDAEMLTAAEHRRRLHWSRYDPDFDGVRAAHHLRALPPPEAEAWRALWHRVDEALEAIDAR